MLSAYAGRFAECAQDPPRSVVEAADLAARDSAHLAALFDEAATGAGPATSGRYVGHDARDAVLGLLRHS